MGKEFLGRGWRFPILPDASGALGYVDGDENVEQSLKLLLLTRAGERVMRGSFGTRLAEMVFAPGSEQNLHLIEDEIAGAVTAYEPRVELLEVLAELDPRDETRVNVSVSYRVRRSNSRQSMVFPYYLPRVESR
jgi:phage baseplate assembly protein W